MRAEFVVHVFANKCVVMFDEWALCQIMNVWIKFQEFA